MERSTRCPKTKHVLFCPLQHISASPQLLGFLKSLGVSSSDRPSRHVTYNTRSRQAEHRTPRCSSILLNFILRYEQSKHTRCLFFFFSSFSKKNHFQWRSRCGGRVKPLHTEPGVVCLNKVLETFAQADDQGSWSQINWKFSRLSCVNSYFRFFFFFFNFPGFQTDSPSSPAHFCTKEKRKERERQTGEAWRRAVPAALVSSLHEVCRLLLPANTAFPLSLPVSTRARARTSPAGWVQEHWERSELLTDANFHRASRVLVNLAIGLHGTSVWLHTWEASMGFRQ